MQAQFKTAIFEIHNPSRRKKRMMLDALKRNHLAYSKGLSFLLQQLDEIREGLKGNKQKENFITKKLQAMITPLPLGNAAKAEPLRRKTIFLDGV